MFGDGKKRISLDIIGQLEDDLEANPLDYAKWARLLKQVLAKDKPDQVRATFEKYLAIFKADVCITITGGKGTF